jgi:hypothetical protein
MISEINSALDYNPDLKQYDDNLIRVINRHYLQVSSQYQWLFMQKRHVFTLRQDIKVEGVALNRLTTDGSRVVTLNPTTGLGVKNLPLDIVGQTLLLDNAEYLITHRRDARTFIIDTPISAGTHDTWTIKYMTYAMPRDSIEMLGIMDRGLSQTETISYSTDSTTSTLTGPDRGRFVFLDARKEEYLYLDRRDTGEAFVSIEEMHNSVAPPDFAPSLRLVEFTDTTGETPSAIPSATYEYCYTFTYAGKEGPPSTVSSIAVPSDGLKYSVTVFDLQDTRANYTSGALDRGTGRYKKIYRRIVEKPTAKVLSKDLRVGVGPWRHIATVDESSLSYTDNFDELTTNTVMEGTSFDAKISPSGDLFDSAHLNEIGPRQYLRFWYTPSSDYPVEARYHRRPLRLINATDAPEWPVQYHHYLVYAALKDICMQHGMLKNSQLYDARANELLERMKAKYLSRTDRMYIRRGFDRAMADRERFGIPTKS